MSNFLSQICDLGSARSLEHTACQTTAVGTYAWMAPEVGGSGKITFLFLFQLCACFVHAWLVPRLLYVFCVCWFLCITQLVAMQLYFSWLDGCFECVFTMSSLAQLWVQYSEVDILWCRGNVDTTMWDWLRVEMPKVSSYLWCLQQLTNPEWLPGEHLNSIDWNVCRPDCFSFFLIWDLSNLLLLHLFIRSICLLIPQMLRREKVSKSCDVYSYAVLLFEIATQQQPFPEVVPIMVPSLIAQGKVS